MVRYVGWLANTMLFVLCCFLVADTANAIIAALLTEPAPAFSPVKPGAGAEQSSWDERQVIVRRNLFHSSSLAAKPVVPEIILDEIEETELPLKLWGTIASLNPELAWASVEELDARTKGARAVRVGDSIKTAEVLAIERRRIVLLEKGTRRALTLDEDVSPQASQNSGSAGASRSARSTARSRRSPPSSTGRSRSARKAMSDRVRRIGEEKAVVDREDVMEAMSNPASLYTQARILPKVGDNGEFSGIEISAIKPGSVFEQAGIEDGDVITAIGGEAIDNVGDSKGLFSALSDGQPVNLTVRSASGEILTKQVQFPSQ